MNQPGIVTEEDAALIETARALRDAAEQNWRRTILGVADRSSIRAAAKAARISPNTIFLWTKEDT